MHKEILKNDKDYREKETMEWSVTKIDSELIKGQGPTLGQRNTRRPGPGPSPVWGLKIANGRWFEYVKE